MTPFVQLILDLFIIIFMAKFAGWVSTRLGQPSVLGELIVGLILGPSLLDITHLWFMTDEHLPEIINELGELGVLFLMFIAGLELHFSDLARYTRVSIYSGFLGVLVPVGFGWMLGSMSNMDLHQSLFLGLALGATSVSISVQTLIEIGKLRSRVGLGLLGSAVFDDILVILLLSVFLALIDEGSNYFQIVFVIARMVIYLTGFTFFGYWILPKLVKFVSRLSISQGISTLAILVILFFGFSAELIGGMAAITGSFLAGLMFSRTSQKQEVEHSIRSIAYGFFVPIFFVNIGLSVDLSGFQLSSLRFIVILSLFAIIGKVLGAGIGAKVAKFSWLESLQLGIGMVSRGEVGLIVAKIGLDAGLISNTIFSAIIAMVIITTLVTPVFLRASFRVKGATV